ncbi:NAD(P)-dependent alcohol dehydrogenase [Pelomonas sp. CA6]|uniref:zinc-dependent alcohol dehydrogenase family protein n=1 Tax=Pelomonas sp. CA6 TaxID=2907999 RepID=UPI001F4C4025|nr:NAD(P)-dependent alcohol dehydrogenase [Pelomonas sp. CA6]MCH7343115.1 NAD(P)-dependent alcohol dehydrogenase [Pelomonas sp. CA6]
MERWIVKAGAKSLESLVKEKVPTPQPGPGQIRVGMKAVSLNARDQLLLSGQYGVAAADFVPLADGAGVVEAVGPGVDAWAIGDKVTSIYFNGWPDGPPRPGLGWGLGSHAGEPGVLAQSVVLDAARVVRMPRTLSFEEAATLPCAALTAWSALNGDRPYRRALAKGDKVLVTGTGSVALFASLLAVAAGAQVVATTSQDSKTDRLLSLGVCDVINYRTQPDWGSVAAERWGGFDRVVNAAGSGVLDQCIAALAPGGEIALMGLYQHAQAAPDFISLMMKGASIRGTAVGSANAYRDMLEFIDAHAVRPPIGRIFDFDQAQDAYREAAAGKILGTVVIRLAA